MEKVIPVVINGEPRLIDETELRSICALENIPYDDDDELPQLVPNHHIINKAPPPLRPTKEIRLPDQAPPVSSFLVDPQSLALLQPGDLIAVPISEDLSSSGGDTILLTNSGQVQLVSDCTGDVIFSASAGEEDQLHQSLSEMIKIIAPGGQQEDLIVSNESKVIENAEELPLQSEFIPGRGFQSLHGGKILLNSNSKQEEICEILFRYRDQTRRVIVPLSPEQFDLQEVATQTGKVLLDSSLPFVGAIRERKVVSTADQIISVDVGALRSMGGVHSKVDKQDASIGSQDVKSTSVDASQLSLQASPAQQTILIARQSTGSVMSPILSGSPSSLITVRSPLVTSNQGTRLVMSPTPLIMSPQETLLVNQPALSAASIGSLIQVVTPIRNDNIILQNIVPKVVQKSTDNGKVLEEANGVDENTSNNKTTSDQPQMKEIVHAFCETCGHNSRDLKVCQKCRRPLPVDAKTITMKIMVPQVSPTQHNKSIEEKYQLVYTVRCEACGRTSVDLKNCTYCKTKVPEGSTAILLKVRFTQDAKEHSKPDSAKKRKCQRKKKVEEPVTLSLLSSDEDEENPEKKRLKFPLVVDKEPEITNETASPFGHIRIEGGGLDLADIITSPDIERALLQCRTVRIGSYKTVPEGKVAITEFGLYIKVPSIDTKEMVTVKIFKNEIIKILANFGKTIPVLFYYITASGAEKIRRLLGMLPQNQTRGPYFDPTSTVEKLKRITLLPEKIPEETRLFLKTTYDSQCLLEILSTDEANSILVRAAPSNDATVDQQAQSQIRGKENFMPSPNNATPAASGVASAATPSRDTPIQAIMVYPPPPAKGGISINTEDYGCLGEDHFLNDVIIDFYLKYYLMTQLSPEEQHRTHIFSSFFYKRLTTKIPPRPDDKHSPAERRHNRVRSWTKHVDLFSKDFIVIPINENSHWFLGVICFPGLTQAVKMSDGKPAPNPSKRKVGAVPQMIGGTTITRINQEPLTITLEPDEEDRDEAEASDNDLEPNSSEEEPEEETEEGSELLDDATHPAPKPKVKKEPLEPIKQPCILIFDSLAGASRSKVCATLREYLQVEYDVRHRNSKGKREINKNTMKASVVKVPQQTNYTDCGLYVLQYVEAFFQSPITDYRMPIKQLVDWFDTSIVSKKRYQIQQLLHKLMEEQNVDTSRLNLPVLNLHPDGTGKLYLEEEEEEDEDMAEDMDMDDFEEMEEDDDMMEEEEDEDMQDFHRTGEIGNSSVPSVATNQTEDLRARLQRKELTISSSISPLISLSSASVTTTQTLVSPSKPPVPPPPPSPSKANLPQSITVRKVFSAPESPSFKTVTSTSSASSHARKLEAISITSTSTGKRKVVATSLKDVRNPRLLQQSPQPQSSSPSSRSVDIKKM